MLALERKAKDELSASVTRLATSCRPRSPPASAGRPGAGADPARGNGGGRRWPRARRRNGRRQSWRPTSPPLQALKEDLEKQAQSLAARAEESRPGAGRRAEALGERAGAGGAAQPADGRPARAACRGCQAALERRGGQGQGAAGADRRPRPAAERRAGQQGRRSWRATARSSSAGCARCWATSRTSASSATASSSSRRCCSRPARPSWRRTGRPQLRRVADALKDVAGSIPGRHRLDPAGRRPHRPDRRSPRRCIPRTGSCRSARAMSVVRLLIDQGIPAAQLSPPPASASSTRIDAGRRRGRLRRNRRIEIKLTQR